jgi:multiple antibiotic resistance protein
VVRVNQFPEIILELAVIYSQLFAIMDPFTTLPIYLSSVDGLSPSERKRIVLKTTIVTGSLLLVFTVAGNWVLTFFGISIPALRLGGGILLMAIAIDMLGGLPKTKSVDVEEVAVVPLATPLLVGPGTITSILLLETIYGIWEILLVDVILAITVYITLHYGEEVFNILGRSFVTTLGRVMAVIVAAIAAQMMHDALADWFPALLK